MDVDTLLAKEAERADRYAGPCKTARQMDALDPDVRAKVEAAGLSPEALSRVLTELGYPVGATVARRHANGDCACRG